MHHHSRFSSAHHHQHWHPVVLLAPIALGLLGACGTAPNAPAQKPVTPVPSTEAAHQAMILLYATYSAPYNTFDSQGFQDTVTALKASDGAVLWQSQVSGVVDTTNEQALIVRDGIVYITATRLAGTPGTNSVQPVSLVSALRATDGTVLWRYQPDEQVQFLAVTAGVAYISVASGTISAFRAIDGTLLWHQSADPTITSLIEEHDLLYISTSKSGNGSVSALHSKDGSLAWQAHLEQQAFGNMSLADGIIYVGGAKAAGTSWIPSLTLYALQASDGHLLWQTQSNLLFFTGVSNGKVFLISLTPPTISALRSKDGSAIWQQQPQAFPTSLVVQDAVLYAVRSTQGPLMALQASDGTSLWDSQGKEVDGASPSISLMTDQERAYISSLFVNNGFFGSTLEVRKATDGTVVWTSPYQKVSSIFKLVDGVIYVGASAGFYQGDRQSGSVCALQASTGTKLWCHQATTGIAPLTIG